MSEMLMRLSKNPGENAKAIRNCLAYLSREAKDAGLKELAQLIDVAALAASEVSHKIYH